MKQILFAVNSEHINANTVDFASSLAELTGARLNGVFPEKLMLEEEIVINESWEIPFVESVSIHEVPETELMRKQKEENLRIFKQICEKKDVVTSIQTGTEMKTYDLLGQTRFSDLLIIDAAISFWNMQDDRPTSLVKDILQTAECPVVISPEEFGGVDNIVFFYFENRSSVFAMKQFTYLFPELDGRRSKVISLSTAIDSIEQEGITNLLQDHYSDIEFISVAEDAEESFINYLLKKKNDFVVMGAYGRGLLASFFENDNEETEKTTSLPIFIAHY